MKTVTILILIKFAKLVLLSQMDERERRTRRKKLDCCKSLQPGPDEVIHGTRGSPLGEEAPWSGLNEVVESLEEVPDNCSS